MTEPYYADDRVTLLHGSCLDVLRDLPDASVDAVVCDPPYGLANTTPEKIAETVTRWVSGERDYLPTGKGFMGNPWDAFVPPVAVWDDCLRVLKPGGHVLAFAGSRTVDLMTLSLRLAGFDIRDSIAWLYGSGFPKSLDVSKAIDKQRHDADDKLRVTTWLADVADRNGVTRADVDAHMGTSDMGGWWLSRLRHRCAIPTLDQVPNLLEVLRVSPDDVPDEIRALLIDLNGMKGQPGPAWFTREVTGSHVVPDASKVRPHFAGATYQEGYASKVADITAPATDDARTWQGWGTALKPAFEPVVVARKPFAGTVAGNVLEHGTGALNIDGCRVGREDGDRTEYGRGNHLPHANTTASLGKFTEVTPYEPHTAGRWPANVVLDESQAEALDEQSGDVRGFSSQKFNGGTAGNGRDKGWGNIGATEGERREGYNDNGGASRFFYIAREDNEPCSTPDPASTAGPTSSPSSALGDSAPGGAATSALPGTDRRTGSLSTSGTPSGSKPSATSGTPTTPSTADESSTTTSPSTSDGSAAPATSGTTQSERAHGATVCGVDELHSRFMYAAKASKRERPNVDGVSHPTVKPLALMRWLVRLVTPPGGTVLEPFAGSGTTIEAALLEGFNVIGIEREADYLPLIEARIARALATDTDLFGGAA